MSRKARLLGWPLVAVVLALAIAYGLRAGEPEQGKGPAAKPPANQTPHGIIVSRETTFITGPLRSDGSVDYLAAINDRCSQGVTPENNAAIPLLQAVGFEMGRFSVEIPESVRQRFYKMLGIAPLPKDGPYLQSYIKYAGGDNPASEVALALDEEEERIMDRPWSKADVPLAAAWLEEYQKQIDLIVAATKRPRFYSPLVVENDGPGAASSVLSLVLMQFREAARALRIRAMFRAGAGKPEDAWQDLLACHRLARLVDQGPYLIDGLVAIALEGIALYGDAALAREGKLTAEQAKRFAAEFRKLPPMTKMADRIDWAERLEHLDRVSEAASKGIGELTWSLYRWRLPEGKVGAFANRLVAAAVDWNETMRVGNQWFDRTAPALSKPTHKERQAASADLDRDLRLILIADLTNLKALGRSIEAAGSLRGGLGRHLGNVIAADSMPAISACMNVEDRTVAMQSLVSVAFALAAYRADRGEYPADLAALVPKYIPAVPADVFSDGPLRYRREGPGYLVYSVGPNGIDDGGRNRRDDPEDNDAADCDDIAIRVPLKEREKPK